MYGQYGGRGGYGRGGRGYYRGGRNYGRGGRNPRAPIDNPDCILSLKPMLSNDKITKVKVKCRHSTTNTRKAQCILYDGKSKHYKELALLAYHDFLNNCTEDALNCNTGN